MMLFNAPTIFRTSGAVKLLPSIKALAFRNKTSSLQNPSTTHSYTKSTTLSIATTSSATLLCNHDAVSYYAILSLPSATDWFAADRIRRPIVSLDDVGPQLLCSYPSC